MSHRHSLRGVCGRRPARARPVWWAAVAAALLSAAASCRDAARTDTGSAVSTTASEAANQRLFEATMDSWRHPERLDSDEVVRQALDNLNIWLKTQKPLPEWKLDPMAAEVLRPLADRAPQLAAIVQSLEKPRLALQLKAAARQLEAPCERLANLSRQGVLDELNRLDAELESAIGEMAETIRGLDTPEKAAQIDALAKDAFTQQLKDRAKLERFLRLSDLAALLDEPARLRDPQRLAMLVQQIREESKGWNQAEIDALIASYSDLASRHVGRGQRLKSVVQLQILRRMSRQLDLLAGVAEVRGLRLAVGGTVANLRSAANRSGRQDVASLAARLEEAAARGDLTAVEQVSRELDALAKPRDPAELKQIASQLAEPIDRLRAVGQRLTADAKAASWPNLALLALYVDRLAQQLRSVAEGLGNVEAMTQKIHRVLDSKPVPTTSDMPDRKDVGLEFLSLQFVRVESSLAVLAETWKAFEGFAQLEFVSSDQMALETAVLLNAASYWCRGDEVDDVRRAERLFDWTMRNIQALPSVAAEAGAVRIVQSPWEVLMYGSGTAEERAAVFVLLAQQQGLDAAILSPAPSGDSAAPPVLVGLLTEGRIYVFDPALGLPIPAKKGIALDESGQLVVRPAALDDLASDDALLRKLDDDPAHRYPLTAAQLTRVVAEIEAPLPFLSQRMRLVESRASGERPLVLSSNPTAQAERFRAVKALSGAAFGRRLLDAVVQRMALGEDGARWSQERRQPFMINAPAKRQFGSLYLGRLSHLQGNFSGDDSAVKRYQESRFSDDQIRRWTGADPQKIAMTYTAKIDASYWLGLLTFDQRRYASTEDYLNKHTIEAVRRYAKELPPQLSKMGLPAPMVRHFVERIQIWDTAAAYNLGRAYEALRRYDEAIAKYVHNTRAADYAGQRLRARWLAELTGKKLPVVPLPGGTAAGASPLPAKPAKVEPKKVDGKTPPQMPDLPDLPDLPTAPAKR